MVRLKEYLISTCCSNLVISIPYGAIKREFTFEFNASEDKISIPYGAIKREFTFEINASEDKISIPYGANKRSDFISLKSS